MLYIDLVGSPRKLVINSASLRKQRANNPAVAPCIMGAYLGMSRPSVDTDEL